MQSSSWTSRDSVLTRLLVLGGLLVLVFAVAWMGSTATTPKIPTWYAGLAKPPLTPPSGLFAPVWSTLYALMAIAAWRIWFADAGEQTRRMALIAFGVQLALNALWSQVFFGMTSPWSGLAVILALLAALGWTLRVFWPIDRPAALLLAPYAAWVSFAAYLNAGIAALN